MDIRSTARILDWYSTLRPAHELHRIVVQRDDFHHRPQLSKGLHAPILKSCSPLLAEVVKVHQLVKGCVEAPRYMLDYVFNHPATVAQTVRPQQMRLASRCLFESDRVGPIVWRSTGGRSTSNARGL